MKALQLRIRGKKPNLIRLHHAKGRRRMRGKERRGIGEARVQEGRQDLSMRIKKVDEDHLEGRNVNLHL